MTAKVKLENSPLIKSLLFSDKKPNTHFMILAESNTKPEKGKIACYSAFWKKVGTTHNNVRMSKEEVLQEVLKSKKGALNPFSLINDKAHHIKKLIIEEKLFESEWWAFHPMDNSATVELTRDDFFKFLTHAEVPFEKLNLLEQVEKVEEKVEEKKGEKKEKEKEVINLLGIEAKKSSDFSGWYQ